jgi:hypothetical protein
LIDFEIFLTFLNLIPGFDSLSEEESSFVPSDFLSFNRVETSLEPVEIFFDFLLDIRNYDLSNYLFFG